MNITILGATGWIGGHIMAQAKANGHNVTAVVRDAGKVTDDTAVAEFDLQSQNDIGEVLTNADVVIASIGGRAAGNHELVARTAERLLVAMSGSNTR